MTQWKITCGKPCSPSGLCFQEIDQSTAERAAGFRSQQSGNLCYRHLGPSWHPFPLISEIHSHKMLNLIHCLAMMLISLITPFYQWRDGRRPQYHTHRYTETYTCRPLMSGLRPIYSRITNQGLEQDSSSRFGHVFITDFLDINLKI